MYFHSPAEIVEPDGTRLRVCKDFIIWSRPAWFVYGNELAPWDHSFANLYGAGVDEMVRAEGLPFNRPIHLSAEDVVEKHLRLLHEEVHDHEPGDVVVVESVVRMWLREVARHGTGVPPEWEESDGQDAVGRARAYIMAHLSEEISLKAIAASAGVCSSRLNELFHERFHTSPYDYVIEMRLQRAERLLRNDALSIAEVAGLVGYEDPLYLSKLFHKRMGHSPTEFRLKLAHDHMTRSTRRPA